MFTTNVKMFVFALLFPLIVFSHGFLLDNNAPQHTDGGTVKGYLSVSEYYDDNKQRKHDMIELRHETEQVRLDMDKSLALLTEQLQQKFGILEQRVKENCNRTETRPLVDKSEQRIKELEDNNTKLQQQYDDLLRKYTEQERELLQIRNETRELEKVFRKADNIAKTQFNAQELNILVVVNKTMELENKFNVFEQLKAIQQLQDFSALQKRVQTLSSQTHLLIVNERARSQDFLALYNGTKAFETYTKTRFQQVLRDQNVSYTRISDQFQNFRSKRNISLAALKHNINTNEQKIKSVDQDVKDTGKRDNKSLSEIEQKIVTLTETVLLNACISNTTTFNTIIIKLDDVKLHTGIHNLTDFRTSGMFTCRKPGLYLVSASIMSQTYGATYSIMKNSNPIFTTYISLKSVNYVSASGVVAIELQAWDTLWVKAENKVEAFEKSSCMTIVKLK